MKELYWIDDDFVQMKYIAQGVISKLWKLEQPASDGIRSKIIVFGNAYMEDGRRWEWEKLPSQQDEDDANEEIDALYVECCYMLDGPNQEQPTYNANRELVQDAVLYLLKNDQEENKQKYVDILQTWTQTANNIQSGERNAKEIKQVQELIKQMNIAEGAAVGIDLSLLHGDIERIRNEQRVISMELYRQLKSAFKCFLYSAQAGEVSFSEKWKETFVKCYPEIETSNEKIENLKIYERKDFLFKGSEDIASKLAHLFDERG